MTGLRLGISACFLHADPQRAFFKGKTLLYLEQSLGGWVMSAGVPAYLVPAPEPRSTVSPAELVAGLDGLVLAGGTDVCPRSYGEEPLRPEWVGDAVRDRYELALVRELIAQGKPVLGVCRGAQLLNVAFGGTLYQDLATQAPGPLTHRDAERYDRNFHELRVEPEARVLARLYPGLTRARINSVHHQAVKALGRDLVVEARSVPDGIVEAFRREGEPWVYAVQWHPEWHDPADPTLLDGRPLLGELLSAARARKGR